MIGVLRSHLFIKCGVELSAPYIVQWCIVFYRTLGVVGPNISFAPLAFFTL